MDAKDSSSVPSSKPSTYSDLINQHGVDAKKLSFTYDRKSQKVSIREKSKVSFPCFSSAADSIIEPEYYESQNYLGMQVSEPLKIFKPVNLTEGKDSVLSILRQSKGHAVRAKGSGHSLSNVQVTSDFLIDTHGLCDNSKIEFPLEPSLINDLSQVCSKDKGKYYAADKEYMFHTDWKNESHDGSPSLEQKRILLETAAGIRLRDLNKILDERMLGLINMGGWDAQTVAGVISTSTHGSGIQLPPFPDMIKSIVLATTGQYKDLKPYCNDSPQNNHQSVYFYRIEPKNGITNPEKWKSKYGDAIHLIQDDNYFNSTLVAMGCFGVIYSMVLEVMPKYWLTQTRTMDNLENVFQRLSPDSAFPNHVPGILQRRNVEILVNPYPTIQNANGFAAHQCLITERVSTMKDPNAVKSKRDSFVTKLVETVGNLFKNVPNILENTTIARLLVAEFLNLFHKTIPSTLSFVISGMATDAVTDLSHNIYVGSVNILADSNKDVNPSDGKLGMAVEIGVSVEKQTGQDWLFTSSNQDWTFTNDNIKEIVGLVIENAVESSKYGSYQTGPFSLRFIKRSNAYMSMMSDRTTCMLELLMLNDTRNYREVMYRYEHGVLEKMRQKKFMPRIHWGLEFDLLNGTHIGNGMYPKMDEWLKVYKVFNSEGTFNSTFTERMGFNNK